MVLDCLSSRWSFEFPSLPDLSECFDRCFRLIGRHEPWREGLTILELPAVKMCAVYIVSYRRPTLSLLKQVGRCIYLSPLTADDDSATHRSRHNRHRPGH